MMGVLEKKRNVLFFLLCFVIFIIGMIYGQVGFNMEERTIIEKYKHSNAKLDEGRALFEKGKYEKAEKKLLECLEVFPQNADAHFYLAQIYYKSNDLGQALQSVENAKKHFQFMNKFYTFTYQEMLNTLRDQKFKLQEYIRKQESALASLKSQPQTDSTRSEIQRIENDINQNKGQISMIDTRLNSPLVPVTEIPSEFFYIHANILFKMKNYEEAANQYLETIKLDPRHNFAYNNLASIYYMAKDYQRALDCLQRAEENGVKINTDFKKACEEKLGKK
jgi:tetratricopeptide (TPR) repeat protein